MSASFKQTGFGGGLVPDFQSPLPSDQPADDLAADDSLDDSDSVTEDASPEGLLGEAVTAFSERRESDAFKYLYAYLLCDDEAAAKHSLDWYTGIAQPKVAFRWGVGVNYTAPSGFEGKPPVIGDPEDVRLPGANCWGPSPSTMRTGEGCDYLLG